MKGWKYTRRRINGVSRKVKVRKKSDGSYMVRVCKNRNRHD
jgi:hypothetical protein